MLSNPRDLVNVVRALTAPAVFYYPLFFGFPGGHGLFYFMAAFAVIGDMNYILHLHVHHPFTKSAFFNRLIDFSLGSVTGMTSANWRIQHVYGHHAGLDDLFVVNAAAYTERYSVRGALLFSLLSIWPTYWSPIKESYLKGIGKDLRRPVHYRSAFFEQLAQAVFLAVLALHAPAFVFFFMLPWYALVYFISRYVDYLNHYACRASDTYDVANNCVNTWFNRTTHNFGYHTAHHLYSAAHWTDLPKIHASIAHLIPAQHIKKFNWAFSLMPYHFWLSQKGLV